MLALLKAIISVLKILGNKLLIIMPFKHLFFCLFSCFFIWILLNKIITIISDCFKKWHFIIPAHYDLSKSENERNHPSNIREHILNLIECSNWFMCVWRSYKINSGNLLIILKFIIFWTIKSLFLPKIYSLILLSYSFLIKYSD